VTILVSKRQTNFNMKNAVFWDLAPCRSCVNRHFGGTYRCSHLLRLVPRSRMLYPEDGGDTILRNMGSHKIYYTAPEDGILHSHHRENLKSYNFNIFGSRFISAFTKVYTRQLSLSSVNYCVIFFFWRYSPNLGLGLPPENSPLL
jgi:hypothetical protein